MNDESGEFDIAMHIQSVLNVVHPIVATFTFPLFAADQRDRPDLYASSVLIECDGNAVLVTAAHAIYEIGKAGSDVHLGAKEILALPQKFVSTSVSGEDDLDIAAMVIPQEILVSQELRPLPSISFNLDGIAPPPHVRCVHGFPLSKNKFNSRGNVETHVFTKYGFTYAGASRDLDIEYSANGKCESIHQALHYQRQSKNDQGETVTPPNPKGMSGGGMWSVPDSFEPDKVLLDGVSIEYRDNRLVFATRVEHVVDFVRQNVLSLM